MCAGCAITAAAGATGARTWLQNQHLTWLTPKRMRAATLILMIFALLFSTVGLSGSGRPAVGQTPPASAPVPARSP